MANMMRKLTNDLADVSGSARLVAVILRAVHKPVHKRYHNNAAIIFLILEQKAQNLQVVVLKALVKLFNFCIH